MRKINIIKQYTLIPTLLLGGEGQDAEPSSGTLAFWERAG
jgi:hypothetical protein